MLIKNLGSHTVYIGKCDYSIFVSNNTKEEYFDNYGYFCVTSKKGIPEYPYCVECLTVAGEELLELTSES